MSVTVTTAPTGEPVTVEQLRDHLNVSHNDDDLLLETIGKAARAYVETFTRRQLMQATLALHLDTWPRGNRPIVLPRPPLLAVSSIIYTDTDGTSQTLATSVYAADANRDPGVIYLKDGQQWPTDIRSLANENAVTVNYTAGYSSSSTRATQRGATPENARHAILMLAADMYEIREPTVVGTIVSKDNIVKALLYSVVSFGETDG